MKDFIQAVLKEDKVKIRRSIQLYVGIMVWVFLGICECFFFPPAEFTIV